ncbi:thioredoxin-disulfide reductase [Candidatus Peregrinibacteria bacterium CG11_big_fil_rev_8_21_14_0_20_46_8]|nr:MAG: thioredoxin-disulfide reductase [Candidatus Peregrinibacteria bacterium CG11_big_fil_rev_8_21_14_0_20_46_8]
MEEQKQSELYDVIIIGSGVAGYSAGMYCGRFNLKTLVIGDLPGGVITTTHLVENYPGIPSITGQDMGMVFMEHAKKFGAVLKNGRVKQVEKHLGEQGEPPMYKVSTAKDSYMGKTIIFATGTEYRKLGVPGEKELNSKGVSYCALCDGAFFKEKEVVIVGGGDSSAIEALILAEHCKKVTMLVRKDILRAEPVNHKKVMEHPKIEVKFKTEVAEIRGTEKVESLLLKSGEEMKVDGVFIAIGHIALSGLAKEIGVELDDHGQIKINRKSETNVPGVFAAGDVVDSPFKQAITGASEAVVASYFAYTYLQKTATKISY